MYICRGIFYIIFTKILSKKLELPLIKYYVYVICNKIVKIPRSHNNINEKYIDDKFYRDSYDILYNIKNLGRYIYQNIDTRPRYIFVLYVGLYEK